MHRNFGGWRSRGIPPIGFRRYITSAGAVTYIVILWTFRISVTSSQLLILRGVAVHSPLHMKPWCACVIIHVVVYMYGTCNK